MEKRNTVRDIRRMWRAGERIAMLTAYDYPGSRAADEAGIPILLVGDSLAMVVLGYDSTLSVSLDEMIHHGRAVVRGSERAHVVVDMPFGSYQVSSDEALRNAMRIMRETGCGSVKLEGGERSVVTVKRLVEAGVPVMGHIGLTPQSVHALGGYRVQGKTVEAADQLLRDAHALARAGAYAIVLELVVPDLAEKITRELSVPTIGIGSGAGCSGQVQVFHDILGLFDDFSPKHTHRFAEAGHAVREGIAAYRAAVQSGAFPARKPDRSSGEPEPGRPSTPRVRAV